MTLADTSPLFIASTLVLFATLIALSVIDARSFRLPDVLTLPLIAAGLGAAFLLQQTLILHLAGAAFGYLMLVAIELLYKHFRGREGLGRGDAKLLAAGGAWCGVAALPMIVLIGSFTALAYVLLLRLTGRSITATTALPFGPFLALGIALVWLLRALSPGFAGFA